MGQAKLKAVRAVEKSQRAGTSRLQSIKIEGQIVHYDDRGRATSEGSGTLEAFFLMEADIPSEIVALVRRRYPKVDFVSAETAPPVNSE